MKSFGDRLLMAEKSIKQILMSIESLNKENKELKMENSEMKNRNSFLEERMTNMENQLDIVNLINRLMNQMNTKSISLA